LLKKAKTKSRYKQGWEEIGGKRNFYRSSWEVKYARHLQNLKSYKEIKDWLHEPQTFWFDGIRRGVVSYLPDFKVFRNDGTHYWVEVKGFMDAKSATKIKRFKKYFPNETLIVIDNIWFNLNKNVKAVDI